MNSLSKLLTALAVSFLLAGCGGGDEFACFVDTGSSDWYTKKMAYYKNDVQCSALIQEAESYRTRAADACSAGYSEDATTDMNLYNASVIAVNLACPLE